MSRIHEALVVDMCWSIIVGQLTFPLCGSVGIFRLLAILYIPQPPNNSTPPDKRNVLDPIDDPT